MRRVFLAMVMVIASTLGMFTFTAPAQAAEWNYCNSYNSTISWAHNSFSVYGKVADVRARVFWTNCLGDGSRNNAMKVVFGLKGDNCWAVDGYRFNLGPVEGLDIDVVDLNGCTNGVWINKTVNIESPGYTFEKQNWGLSASVLPTVRGFSLLGLVILMDPKGPSEWGGRANITKTVS